MHILGEDSVSFDAETIEAHGYSDWSTSNSSGRPVAVVYPTTTEQVSQIAKICNQHAVPMGMSKCRGAVNTALLWMLTCMQCHLELDHPWKETSHLPIVVYVSILL